MWVPLFFNDMRKTGGEVFVIKYGGMTLHLLMEAFLISAILLILNFSKTSVIIVSRYNYWTCQHLNHIFTTSK